MAKDLKLVIEDRPGTLADLGEALGKAGVNISGTAGIPCQGKGEIHILVEDAAGARKALEAVRINVAEERDVLVLDVEDKPGVLGETCRRIGDAGVNIDLLYLATGNRLVIGADNLDKAKSAI